MDNATKLPVSYQEVSDAYTHIVRGPNNEFLCSGPQDSSGQTEAFMRLIVTAVNHHQRLVDALRKARAVAASPQSFDLENVESEFRALLAENEGERHD